MNCQHCTAETTDGIALCKRCTVTAERAFENIAAYHADLALVPTDGGQRRRSNTAPDPTGVAAAAIGRDPVSEADEEATNALTTWARCLVDDRYHGEGRPPRRVADLAPWLAERLPSIVTLEWAGPMLQDLLRVEQLLRKVAARAKTGQYLGTCGNQVRPEVVHDDRSCACACHLSEDYDCDVPGGCGREVVVLEPETCRLPLYADRHARLVRCRCGANWDARARREQLVRAVEDELAPVAVIARLAATFTGEASVGKVEERIKKWTQRGKVAAVTTRMIDGRPRKVYRVGDVLDLLADTPSKGSDRQAG